eukprot:355786-Alexandrium_andersonii.AAC.1
MSASLVGSEMCIRDSTPTLEVHRRQHPTAVQSQPWRGWFGPVARLRPVSYTHLTLPTICSV